MYVKKIRFLYLISDRNCYTVFISEKHFARRKEIDMNESKVRIPKGRLTALLFLGMALYAGISVLHGVLLGNIIETFSLTASRQGFPNTAAFAGAIVGLLGTFLFSSRLRKWLLLTAAMALCSVALAGLSIAASFVLFTCIWFVLGIGMGLLDTLLSACLAPLYDGKAAVRMMCIMHMAYGLSSTALPILMKSLLQKGFFWKNVYLLLALYTFLLLLSALVFRIWRMDTPPKTQNAVGNTFRLIIEGRLYFWIGAMFFHGFFLSGLMTWINRYSETSGQTSSIPAMSFMFLGLMLSRLIVPFLPVSIKNYISAAGFGAGTALFLGIMVPKILHPCLLISGLLFGSLIPCLLSLACGRLKENTLFATTSLMLSLYLGQSVSSSVIGALENAYSLRAGIGLCGICMIGWSLCCCAERIMSRKYKRS